MLRFRKDKVSRSKDLPIKLKLAYVIKILSLIRKEKSPQSCYCLSLYLDGKDIQTSPVCYPTVNFLIMKRKLDENDVPTSVETTESKKPARNFEDFGLDPRLLQALTSQKFSKPTLVQAEAIPLALDGKDILGMRLYL